MASGGVVRKGKQMRRALPSALLPAALLLAAVLAQSAPATPNPVVASATGSGHLTSSAGFNRTFSFGAVRHADGSATGEARLNARGTPVSFQIRIDCLKVTGNTAVMSGDIVYTSDPNEASTDEYVRFTVQDNGTPGSAGPDRMSGVPFNPSRLDCEDPPLAVDRDVQRGDIQVR